jgi:hypothetical protein
VIFHADQNFLKKFDIVGIYKNFNMEFRVLGNIGGVYFRNIPLSTEIRISSMIRLEE